VEPNLLYTNMHYLLDRTVEQALLASFDLPTRQYVTLGGAVFDCEQVSVSAINSDPGLVSSDPGAINLLGNCDVPWNTNYEVAIVLCAAERIQGQRGEKAPPVEQVDADALKISAAYAVLRDVVDNIVASGDLGTPSASIAFSQPQGGLIAVVLSLNANVWVNPPEEP
jgi:hypothetical protein